MNNCQQLKHLYTTLLRNVAIYRAVDFKTERRLAMKCKDKIEEIAKEIRAPINEQFTAKITVKKAITPFIDIYARNHLSVPAEKDLEMDLEERLDRAVSDYRLRGLSDWADNIEKIRGRLKFLSAKKKAQICVAIKEGAMLMFMPGKDVLFSRDAIAVNDAFRSSYNTERGLVSQEKTQVKDNYPILDLTQNKVPALLADVPEEPYILLGGYFYGSLFADSESFEPQLKELKKNINQSRIDNNLAPVFEIKPHEYSVMNYSYVNGSANLIQGRKLIQYPLDDRTTTIFHLLPSFKGLKLIAFFSDNKTCFRGEPAKISAPHWVVRLVNRIEI